MKKVGILTFHDTLNYGASLQCYALQKKLCLMGVDVKVIDYKNLCQKKFYSPFNIDNKSLKKIVLMIISLPVNLIKQKKKKAFHKTYLPLSESYYKNTINKANSNFDVFIVGSDQVWNWRLTDNDTTFLLDFVDDKNLRYSYAASLGIKEIDNEKLIQYRDNLIKYRDISIREKGSIELVRSIVDKDIKISVDPVFLLSYDTWKNMAAKIKLRNYILLYAFNGTRAYEYALQISKNTGKKLIYLSAPIKKFGKFKAKRAIGPIDFIGWFLNADYVITDSFHGTAFSIIFKKQFVSFCSDKTYDGSIRIKNLLNELGLQDRILSEKLNFEKLSEEINYNEVDNKLKLYVKASENYLQEIKEVCYE